MRLGLAVLLLLTGCAPGAGGSTAAAEPAGRCAEVEVVPVQGGAHLLGDTPPPVPYNSTPPTSGWHSSGFPPIGVRGPSEALTEPQQVGVLETGAVVVTYRGLPDDERGALEQDATVAPELAGRVAVTPYDRLAEGEVAFAVWGALQRCDGYDPGALRAFVTTYAAEQVAEPGEH